MGESKQTQELTLAADAEPMVALINRFAQFMGITIAEIL